MVAVALVAVSVLATGAINLRLSYLDGKEALAELQGEQAAAAAARIDEFIAEVDRQVASATRALTPQQQRDDFRRILFQVPAISELRAIDGSGREQVAVSRVAPDVIGGAADRSADDVFTKPEPGRPFYGPVSFRDGTEPYLSVAHRDDEGGAVVAELHLSLIHELVSGIDVGRRGQAFVVDADGVLVAHPDLTLVLGGRDLSSLSQVSAAAETPGSDGLVGRDLDGERVLSSFRVIEPLGWAVFVQQPHGVAFDRVNDDIVRTGALLLAAVAFAGSAALVFGRRMVRPLAVLQQSAARIGSGALDERIDIRTGDELEALADEFNRMSARLEVSRDDLREANEELRGSRVRIVAAGDEARRRLERDLHDGAQQHLIAMALKLRLARRAVDDESPVGSLLDELHDDLQNAVTEVRDLAHGIFPPLLESGGLALALSSAARMCPLPTTVEADGLGRYAQDAEATVYFCCVEALQNAAKHAGEGAGVRVRVWEQDGELRFSVADDGVGFDFDEADAHWSHGFVNMADRLGALDGSLIVDSRPGRGTRVDGSVPAVAADP